MKIKRFESIKYSEHLKDKIINNGWSEMRLRYYVGRPSDRIENMSSFSEIKQALDNLDRLNSEWGESVYCLFESKVRVVTQEEIDIILDTKKYNL